MEEFLNVNFLLYALKLFVFHSYLNVLGIRRIDGPFYFWSQTAIFQH